MDVKVLSHGGQNLIDYNDNSVGTTKNVQVPGGNNKDTSKNTSDNTGVSVKDAKKAADKINNLLEDKNVHIEYEQDEDFKNITFMKVVDNDTKEIITEIPSKQIVDMVAQFCKMAGLIIDKKA